MKGIIDKRTILEYYCGMMDLPCWCCCYACQMSTEQTEQQEWNTICTLAKNNGISVQLIYNLRNEINKNQHTINIPTQTISKTWITFTFHSPLVHKITNLFRNTNLHIAFETNNTISTTFATNSLKTH